jgi:hypothetical protein
VISTDSSQAYGVRWRSKIVASSSHMCIASSSGFLFARLPLPLQLGQTAVWQKIFDCQSRMAAFGSARCQRAVRSSDCPVPQITYSFARLYCNSPTYSPPRQLCNTPPRHVWRAGGPYWAICCLFHVHCCFFGTPALFYPLDK